MKATSEQIFDATITLMAAYLVNKSMRTTMFTDDNIQSFIDIAKRTAEMIPETSKNPKHNTGNLFINFPWKAEGVTRTEMETWLKVHSGYTSNRAMQTIINNALAEGVIHKDLKTSKYHPGADGSAA